MKSVSFFRGPGSSSGILTIILITQGDTIKNKIVLVTCSRRNFSVDDVRYQMRWNYKLKVRLNNKRIRALLTREIANS